jgi:hypothetical protein
MHFGFELNKKVNFTSVLKYVLKYTFQHISNTTGMSHLKKRGVVCPEDVYIAWR